MTKIVTILFICLISFGNIVTPVFAQTKTSTKSASPTGTDISATPADSTTVINKLKQIEQLKDKIATKVAELREKDQVGISGTVKKIEKTQITLSTRNGEKKISYADDIVIYQTTKDGRTEQKISKISEESYISVIGIYNEDKSVILGKIIYIETEGLTFFGKIADIERDNYTVTVKTKNGSEVVDIETSTRIFTYGSSKKIEKGGFSKLAVGDPIHVIGTARLKESNKVTGGKLYAFPLLNQSETPTPSLSPTPKVSATKTTLTPTPRYKTTPTPQKKLTPTPTPDK